MRIDGRTPVVDQLDLGFGDEPDPAPAWRDDPTPIPRRAPARRGGLDVHEGTGPFERPERVLAHTDDPETSHDAAASNPLGKNSNRRACLEAHEQASRFTPPGLTDDEIAAITRLDLIEARRRCSDLRSLGFLAWTKPLDYRRTDLGQQARVSVITPAGREALR